MATIHPSRLGLVPQDSKQSFPSRGRSPSPRRRSRSRENGRSEYHSREHVRERDGDRVKRYGRKDGGIEKNGKDIEGSSRRVRRGSPEYEEYRRPASPPAVQAPWRQQENMYPPRRGGERDKPYGGDGPRDRPYGGDGARDRPYGGDGGGSDYFERYDNALNLVRGLSN